MTDWNSYIKEVDRFLQCSSLDRSRIREDLKEQLQEIAEERGLTPGQADPEVLLGPPEQVAAEFSANIIQPPPARWRKDYVSDRKIRGIPLVHICFDPRRTARGIIAIGLRSVGVVSIGVLTAGIISIGVLSVGLLFGIGGSIAVGGLFSCGGVAVAGYTALGGVAVGSLACGGVAVADRFGMGGLVVAGDIGIGGVVHARVAGFTQEGYGEYLFRLPESAEEMARTVRELYPETRKGVLRFLETAARSITG